MLKRSLLCFFCFFTLFVRGQTAVKDRQLIGAWRSATINQSQPLTIVDMGGWVHYSTLEFFADQSFESNIIDGCGSGSTSRGTWKFSEKDSSLVIHLHTELSYATGEESTINLATKYFVKRLTQGELIFETQVQGQSHQLGYLRQK